MLNSRLPDRNPNYFIGSGSKLFSRIQIQIILGSKLLSKIKIQLFSRIRIKFFFLLSGQNQNQNCGLVPKQNVLELQYC